MRQLFFILSEITITVGLLVSATTPCHAQADDAEQDPLSLHYRFASGDLHYLCIQTEEAPIWLEIENNDSHRKLTAATIPTELMVPGYGAFGAQDERRAVVEKIGDYAFRSSRITEIEIPASVRRIGRQSFNYSFLEKVTFNNGLVSIGEMAFANCYGLTSVKLPESLKFTDYACFKMCTDLREVDLPSTLISLGGFTFRYCGALKNIYCRAQVPPTADDSDFGIVYNQEYLQIDMQGGPDTEECVLHVPVGTEELYRNAPGWKLFKNIAAIDDTTDVQDIVNENEIISYRVEEGTLSVTCHTGDIIGVYDINGISLDKKEISTSGEYRYSGKGTVILTLNGRSAKITL